MVNYKRVVCVLAVVATVAVAAPADCRDTHFDQRQNGTENYRLNIDGVVIAVAPSDSFLAAASEIDFSDLFDLDELSELQKPKPPAEPVKPEKPLIEPKPQEVKPQESKPSEPLSSVSMSEDVQSLKKDASTVKKREKAQRLKNRLANFLVPLLRRTRHH